MSAAYKFGRHESDLSHSLFHRPLGKATAFIIVVHLLIAVLDAGDRATFQSVNVDGTVLGALLEHPLWIPLHLTAAIVLAIAYDIPEAIWAHAYSAGLLFAWGAIDLYVGVDLDQPVSLLGPILVLVFGVASSLIVRRWDQIMDERRPPLRRRRHSD